MPGTRLYEPSKLRLKKELTQIQKAARVLRDPGTSSSWKSPLSSTRSAAASLSAFNGTYIRENPLFPPSKESGREKEKRAVLYNWRSNSNNRSSSEKSLAMIDLDGGNRNDHLEIESSSVDNCSSDVRKGNAGLLSMASPNTARREMGKMRFCKSHSSSLMQKQRRKRLSRVVVERKSFNSKMAFNAVGVAQDDSAGLIDESDVTEECYNSDDLHQSSATSSLLSRLMHKNFSQSSVKYSTPALSTSSFNRYFNNRSYGNIGSCDGTTVSFNDLGSEEEDALDLPGSQGCGIPCYWSRKSTPKCISKRRLVSRATQGNLPLLNDFDGGESSFRSGNSDDELSTNFGEIDLEGLSRLEGRRPSSSCRSQDEVMLESTRNLSQRYKPMFFNELVGQNVAVQSIANAIKRRRIAPVYLFHGPRGTGKTSTAKIFAAALNCSANGGNKPCGDCQVCANYASCRSRDIVEVNGKSNKGIESIRCLLKRLVMVPPPSATSSYKVFVIDECQLLPSKSWVALLKFLEEPIPQVVFVFITTDLENVPRAILSRCQKHAFNKIKDVDIVRRLQKIAAEENLEVEPHALELVALNADGSLRDAETMLEQLSLLGKGISSTLVNELVGIISDEKLLELLELALASNTAETVKRARELLDSGADPSILMSQLASLIMDIIAGTYLLDGVKCNNSFFGGRNLTEVELEKLKRALKLLSEAEKQLRVSGESSAWFTATLLQLGSVTSPDFTLSGSSRRQSSRTTDEDQSTASKDDLRHVRNSCHQQAPTLLIDVISSNSKTTNRKSMHSFDSVSSRDDTADGEIIFSQRDMEKLEELWLECIGRCHEKLRRLLQAYGKLISISEVDGVLLAYIAFEDEKMKVRSERYLSSITKSFETALRRSVEVRILMLPDDLVPVGSPHSSELINNGVKLDYLTSPLLDQRSKNGGAREKRQEMPMQRIESIIREQRLETAWLQAVGKGTPRSINCSRPEKNHVLPQDKAETARPVELSSRHWDDELNHEIKVLQVKNNQGDTRIEHHPILPSLLHQGACAGEGSLGMDNQGCESGPGGKGCNILFCWNTGHPRRGKVKQGTSARPPNKCGGFLCLGGVRKSRYG